LFLYLYTLLHDLPAFPTRRSSDLFQHGIVTSASLLVTGNAFEDAVALTRDFPALDVGLHLALVEEQAVLPPEALPTLVDKTGCRSEEHTSELQSRVDLVCRLLLEK